MALMNRFYRHRPLSRTTEGVPAEQRPPRLLDIPFIPFPSTQVEDQESSRSPSTVGFDRKKKDQPGVKTHHNFIAKNLQLSRASFQQERNSSLDAEEDFNHLSCPGINGYTAFSVERDYRNFSLPSSFSTSLHGPPSASPKNDLSISAHFQPRLESMLHPFDQSYDIESEQSHMNWFSVPGAELLSTPELGENYRWMAGGHGSGDLWQ